MDNWKIYDDLIDCIPDDLIVTDCAAGIYWTSVESSEGGFGIAKTIPVQSVPFSFQGDIKGASLKQIAKLSKSWNFVEAAFGAAAISAFHNFSARAVDCGDKHPRKADKNQTAFDVYHDEIKGCKVAVVGHFPNLEQKFGSICDLTILERDPQIGDLPDPACEYILSEQNYVFITGCTLVNKTFPRLLELSRNAKTVIVGPSTILSPIMFDHGVHGLSGFIVRDARSCGTAVCGGTVRNLFDAGEMVSFIRSVQRMGIK